MQGLTTLIFDKSLSIYRTSSFVSTTLFHPRRCLLLPRPHRWGCSKLSFTSTHILAALLALLAFAPRRQILIDFVNMRGKRPPKETNSNSKSSGISAFQLLIFLIATSSIAMNFAMLYGFIPIKGKNLSRLSAEAVRSVESLLKTF